MKMTKMKMRMYLLYACSLAVTGKKHEDLWSQDYVQHYGSFYRLHKSNKSNYAHGLHLFNRFMIQCDTCDFWYQGSCVEIEADLIKEYKCDYVVDIFLVDKVLLNLKTY